MTQIINISIDNDCHPDDLKLAEVRQVFKKKDDLDKKNRPVSFISCVKCLQKNYVPTKKDFMKEKLLNL